MSSNMLNTILHDLNNSNTDIEASAIVSTDGLIKEALLPSEADKDRIGAMSAALTSLSNQMAGELACGNLEQILIKGELGNIVMTYAAPDTVMTVLTTSEARLGLISLDMKRAVDAIQKMT